MSEPLALRLDDVGACTKRYEIYSNESVGIGPLQVPANWLFLKYLPGLRGWGPYREMEPGEWEQVFALLDEHDAKLTVGVTAAWAEGEDELIPFPDRFPDEAATLKRGVEDGLLEVANHGLTHCVLEDDAFKPKLFDGNRNQHREFWDWIPEGVQRKHIEGAQAILEGFFETEVETFVPPGNVFTDATVRIARDNGLRYLSCQTPPRVQDGVAIVGDENVLPFHDREIVLEGVEWLEDVLERHRDRELCFVSELESTVLGNASAPAAPEGTR